MIVFNHLYQYIWQLNQTKPNHYIAEGRSYKLLKSNRTEFSKECSLNLEALFSHRGPFLQHSMKEEFVYFTSFY